MSSPLAERQRLFSNVINGICILLAIGSAYFYFSVAVIDIRKSPNLRGRVERAYLTRALIPESRSILPQWVFAFKLEHSPQRLGVYRRSANYIDLQGSVNVGDELTVYYKPSNRPQVDLDVYQIEKGNAIILNFDTYQHYFRVWSYVFGGAAVVLFMIGQFLLWDAKRRLA